MQLRSMLICAVTPFFCLAAHASLIGNSVNVRYLNPDTSTVTVDFGTQTVTDGLTDAVPGFVRLTFSENQITITNLSPGFFFSNAFNGYDVALLSGTPFSSVTYNAATSSLFGGGSILTFTGSDIQLNLAGTCSACVGGETIVLDVNPVVRAVTPEPSSLALLGTGILGLAGVVRRRLA